LTAPAVLSSLGARRYGAARAAFRAHDLAGERRHFITADPAKAAATSRPEKDICSIHLLVEARLYSTIAPTASRTENANANFVTALNDAKSRSFTAE
jgi:hypothetical protein